MTWYELRCVGEDPLYATGYAKIVWFNPRTGQSVPIPDALREKLIHPE
jgi:acyl-CoA thioester hydrolase